jgi:hypothetical protein
LKYFGTLITRVGRDLRDVARMLVRTVPSMFRFDRMLAYGISQPELEHQED